MFFKNKNRLDIRDVGVGVPVWVRISLSLYREWFSGPSIFLSSHLPVAFHLYSGRGVKLTIYLKLVPKSRKRGSIHPIPITPSRCSASFLCTGTTLHLLLFTHGMSRGSAVGIATGYRLNDWGGSSSSPGKVKNFHFYILSRLPLGSAKPAIQWVRGSFSGDKAAGAWSWPLTFN
jgi:hypothetical protein